MRIKNYTTEINVLKTIGEIEKMLIEYGAHGIHKYYDEERNPSALIFEMTTKKGLTIPFKLPVSVEKWVQMINRFVSKGKLPRRFKDSKEKALKVGWRVVKDWVDAQLTIVESEAVEIEQVLLPYAYDQRNDKTVYERFKENPTLFLPAPNGNDREG